VIAMPVYFFDLSDATGLVQDPDGTHLPDEMAAREHARAVAGELMCNRELDTRAWRLQVRDHEHRPCFHMMFVEVDPRLAELPAEMQTAIINGWTRSTSLHDSIKELHLTVRQVRATIARSEGGPRLAAVDGTRL
jgi:Domain of unknown function (DUF6894)